MIMEIRRTSAASVNALLSKCLNILKIRFIGLVLYGETKYEFVPENQSRIQTDSATIEIFFFS